MAKLVEILARELAEWPEDQDSAWQSHFDLEIYFEGLGWAGMVYATEAADDRGYPDDGVGVTREMWEAERDKLAGKDSGAPEHGFNRGEPGMDLRDYFAAHATDGDVDEVIINYTRNAQQDGIVPAYISRTEARYIHADAMLAERSK